MSSGTVAIEEHYRGRLGATRRERVHWACPCGVLHSVEVVVGVDCAADPELAAALRDGEESFNEVVCPTTGARGRVDVPVVYHDPDEPLLVLVLPAGARARELQERAALLERLGRDVDHDVPPYVVGFAAVHEAAGLRAHLGRAVMDTRGVYGLAGAVTLPRMPVVAGRPPGEDEALTSPRMPAIPTELVTIAMAPARGVAGADSDDEADTQTLARRGEGRDGAESGQPAEGRAPDSDKSATQAESAEAPADGEPGSQAGPEGRHAPPELGPVGDHAAVMGAIDAAIAAIDSPVPAGPDDDGADGPTAPWADRDDATVTTSAVEDHGEAARDDAAPDQASAAIAYAAAAGAYGTGAEEADPIAEAAAYGGLGDEVRALAEGTTRSAVGDEAARRRAGDEVADPGADDEAGGMASGAGAGTTDETGADDAAHRGAAEPFPEETSATDGVAAGGGVAGEGSGSAGPDEVTAGGTRFDPAGADADEDDLDSIDVPIHVAGEGTGIGPAPLDPVAAAPDPSASRRIGPDGRVTIGLVAEGAELAALVAAELEVRLQLHRMSNFPVVALVFGDAAALDGAEGTSPPRWVLLDIGDEEDRAALHGLGRNFELHLEIQDGGRDGAVVATSILAPPLADNVLAALAAAADYLKGIPLDQRSFARARAGFREPDYDRLGLATSLAGELDEEVLRGLATPAQVVRAVALVKRFSQPTGEDWLLMSRSYPVESWQSSRRAVVKRAFELGIWPGPVAAQLAVGEGLARSRKELVVRLQRNFTALLDQPTEPVGEAGEAPAESLPAPAHDLDDAAVRENWKALKAEARALGVPAGEWSQPRSSPIVSESAPIASGTIDLFADPGEESDAFARPGRRRARTAAYGEPVGGDGIGGGRPGARQGLARLESATLVDALEDRERRLAAALELCRRGEESAAGAIFVAVDGLSRADAGLLLGSVGFLGRAAEPHLLAGLRSRKAHIRQGSALALAVMRSEAGVEAICDLLLDDPTAIWRELARALGETGPIAVIPLAARLGHRSMAARERAAWALAHIGARGHRRPLEALASGRDQVAAGVARRAIELIEAAQSDDLAVRGDRTPRDQTMNRSFSRRFFEAVRAERRAAAEAAAAEAAADSETEVDPAAARAVAGRASAMTSGTAVLDESDIFDAVDVDGEGEVEVDDKMEVEVADEAGERDRAPG